MKKTIIILSIILFTVSYIIVCILGQRKSIEYYIPNIVDANIEYDEQIIKCEKNLYDNNLEIDINSVKSGKTVLKIIVQNLTDDGEEVEIKKNLDVYVHPLGIITIGSYLGKCKGDISFLISFYIIVLLILIELIKTYVQRKKENLYSYKNVTALGLIIYISCQYIYSLFFFIYDYCAGYSISLQGLIESIKENIAIVLALTFPFAAIITLLVMISNIKLMKNEGKSYKNMLGVLLGGALCLMTIFNTMFYVTLSNNNILFKFITYLLFMYITYLECILLATSILAFISARKIPKFNKDYIIILGCQIKKDGTLTPLLKNRVDRAIEFSKMQKEATGKDIMFVPSGGQGDDEVISEADAMKNYLLEQGISKENIIVENKSKNTNENIKFSYELIKEKSNNPIIAFSTTNYHVFRAGIIATNQKIIMEGIGAKTKSYYWINAFIREFIATLILDKKSHIKVLISFMIIVFINTLMINILRFI